MTKHKAGKCRISQIIKRQNLTELFTAARSSLFMLIVGLAGLEGKSLRIFPSFNLRKANLKPKEYTCERTKNVIQFFNFVSITIKKKENFNISHCEKCVALIFEFFRRREYVYSVRSVL